MTVRSSFVFPLHDPCLKYGAVEICSVSSSEKDSLHVLFQALRQSSNPHLMFDRLAETYELYREISPSEFQRRMTSTRSVNARPAAIGSVGYIRKVNDSSEFVLLEKSVVNPVVDDYSMTLYGPDYDPFDGSDCTSDSINNG